MHPPGLKRSWSVDSLRMTPNSVSGAKMRIKRKLFAPECQCQLILRLFS